MLGKKDDKKKDKNQLKLEKKIQELEIEKAEYLAGWQRALADYKNLQENLSEERRQTLRLGEENILSDFLPVVENFAKATESQENILAEIKERLADDADLLKKLGNWEIGVHYINKQFQDLFTELTLQAIKTLGEQFDPQYHDAVETVQDETFADNEIVKEVQRGYIYKDKIIRPARVVVNHLTSAEQADSSNK